MSTPTTTASAQAGTGFALNALDELEREVEGLIVRLALQGRRGTPSCNVALTILERGEDLLDEPLATMIVDGPDAGSVCLYTLSSQRARDLGITDARVRRLAAKALVGEDLDQLRQVLEYLDAKCDAGHFARQLQLAEQQYKQAARESEAAQREFAEARERLGAIAAALVDCRPASPRVSRSPRAPAAA